MTRTLPYGSWPSPISAAEVAVASPRLDGARFVGDEIWWSEGLPAERGRTAVMRTSGVVLPAPWSARSRVHEYGGGAWTASDDGVLFFVEHSDQRVWRLRPGSEPEPLTPADEGMRFGDLTLAGGVLYAVRETHTGETVPPRDIVRIDDAGVHSVVAGSDFVAYPAPSPDGTRLAWVSWDHPDMAWDAAVLHVGALSADGTVSDSRVVAGGDGVSALQPEWTGADELTYIVDPDGRWNLYRVALDAIAPGAVRALATADADTGGPLWNLGLRWFAPLSDGRILAVRTNGSDSLVVIDPASGSVTAIDTPLSAYVLLRDVRGTSVLLTGSGAVTPTGLWLLDVDDPSGISAVRGGSGIDADWMPRARAVTFPGPLGEVHAFDYPPLNPTVQAPEGERPPYVVLAHGGPTTHVAGDASAGVAYYTSRGIGVLDVNYAGSTGYGRAYRERLNGQWGIADVADVAAAARGLAETAADPARMAVRGGSAGGWTVLCAAANTDVFAAGISRYGVADLRALAADTHDFEARYLDRLVGPLPEAEDVYVDRSPLSHRERLRVPLLILQGADDPVVPPSQSLAVRDALAANGVVHAYVEYPGEGHGFRQASTIVHAYEAELSFLGQVLGFETPGVPVLPLDRPDR